MKEKGTWTRARRGKIGVIVPLTLILLREYFEKKMKKHERKKCINNGK
jgi:hypothetical protein